ncbi:hypothetical protein [Lysobacter gummosus]
MDGRIAAPDARGRNGRRVMTRRTWPTEAHRGVGSCRRAHTSP